MASLSPVHVSQLHSQAGLGADDGSSQSFQRVTPSTFSGEVGPFPLVFVSLLEVCGRLRADPSRRQRRLTSNDGCMLFRRTFCSDRAFPGQYRGNSIETGMQ